MSAAGLSRACSSAGEPLLPQPIELRLPGRSAAARRRPSAAARRPGSAPAPTAAPPRQSNELLVDEIGAEELDGVGELERRARAGAFVEHRGRQARRRRTCRSDRRRCRRSHDQVDLRERHFVLLDDPHRQRRSRACVFWMAAASATAPGPAPAACVRSGACAAPARAAERGDDQQDQRDADEREHASHRIHFFSSSAGIDAQFDAPIVRQVALRPRPGCRRR